MITITQKITLPDELVIGYAIESGWNEEGMTLEKFIEQKVKAHTSNLFIPYGHQLVEQQLLEARQQLEQAIITPVKEALITEVVVEE